MHSAIVISLSERPTLAIVTTERHIVSKEDVLQRNIKVIGISYIHTEPVFYTFPRYTAAVYPVQI